MIPEKIKISQTTTTIMIYFNLVISLSILVLVNGAPGLVPPFHPIHAPSPSPSLHHHPPPPSPRFSFKSFKSLSSPSSPHLVNVNLPSPKPSSLSYNLDTCGLGASLDIFLNQDSIVSSFSSFFSPSSPQRVLSPSSTTNSTNSTTIKEKKKKTKGPNWWVELNNPLKAYTKNEIPSNRRSGSSTVYQILKNTQAINIQEEEMEEKEAIKATKKKKRGNEGSSNPPYGRSLQNEHGSLSSNNSSLPQIDTTENENEEDNVKCEYMIISGGFTDDDWSTFPIWALDMTYSNPLNHLDDDDDDDKNGEFINGGNYYTPKKSPWVELTPSFFQVEKDGLVKNENEEEEVIKEEEEEGPMGRVGHVSSISSDGYFYVFGGLLYKEKTFYVEESPFVYRMKIGEVLNTCKGEEQEENKEEEEEEENDKDTKEEKKPLVWEKIRPKIVVDSLPSFYKEFENGDDNKDDENNNGDTTSNEMAENGDKNKEDEGENKNENEENNKPPNRQRRTTWTMVGNNNDNTKDNTDSPKKSTTQLNNNNEAISYLDDPSIYLPRGEAQGGHWSTTNSLIIYGGLHVTEIPNPHHSYMKSIQIDKTTGDVWLYQYDTQTFYLLCAYPPPMHQRDGKTGEYPVARTSHAATIVNDELIVHGGMAMDEAHKNWDGTTSWDPLSDVWVFDLKKRVWRERVMVPALARSYHSLVGWGKGSVASFGGFRTAQTVGGEPIAFVFSDTIVSHPSNPQWLKASYPDHAQYTNNPSTSPSTYFPAVTISNRLEHNAVINKDGLMYVWGGRFKTVDQITGTWILNVFGSNTAVSFEDALPDGLEAYEAELEALHLLVGIMLFMSIMFTALYGTLRRQTEEHMNGNNGNGGGTIFARSRRGLSREAIDALPVKTYNRSAANAGAVGGVDGTIASMPDGEVDGNDSSAYASENDDSAEETCDDVGLENEPSMSTTTTAEGPTEPPSSPLGGEEEEETCPICLVEYEDGDKVRQLPCSHEFHVCCIDSWLEAHTSCPSCRHALSNSVTTNNNSNSHHQGSRSSIRQATNLMLGIDDDDMFLAEVVRNNLGGYVRNQARREDEGRGGEGDNIDRSMREEPSMFPLVPSLSLSRFLAGPESGWFYNQREMESADEDDGLAREDTTNEAEQEYIPRENNPEEVRTSRSRLSNLGIPRRLQRRRRGGATEMVTIRRHDNSSQEDPELTIV